MMFKLTIILLLLCFCGCATFTTPLRDCASLCKSDKVKSCKTEDINCKCGGLDARELD